MLFAPPPLPLPIVSAPWAPGIVCVVRDPFADWLFGTRLQPESRDLPGATVIVMGDAAPLMTEQQEQFEAFRNWAIEHRWDGTGALRSLAPPIARPIPPLRFGGNPVPDLAPLF